MNITFKSQGGQCPYFIQNTKKYYIQDVKEFNEYVYQLYVKDIRKKELVFNCFDDFEKYLIQNDAGLMYRCNSFKAYENKEFYFVVEEKNEIYNVRRQHREKTIGRTYTKYIDCLNFAKDFISTRIKETEPTQLDINDLEKFMARKS